MAYIESIDDYFVKTGVPKILEGTDRYPNTKLTWGRAKELNNEQDKCVTRPVMATKENKLCPPNEFIRRYLRVRKVKKPF